MASDGHGFAKGTVALGLGIYAYVQVSETLQCLCYHMLLALIFDTTLAMLSSGLFSTVQNMGTLAEILEDLTIDVEDINKNVKAVQMGITQVLDNQVSLLALSDQRERKFDHKMDEKIYAWAIYIYF